MGPLLIAALLALQDPPAAEQPSGLVLREEGACEGYTLFAPLRDSSTYLIDMEGRVVHTWASDGRPGNAVILTERGSLVRCLREENEVMGGGGQGGRIVELDWDGRVLWDWSLNDERRMAHHDVARLANGNLLVIAWEHRTQEEALAVGRDPEHLTEAGFWPDVVLEIRPVYGDADPTEGTLGGAQVVWEWRAWDHLVQDRDPELAGYGSPADHPGRIDVNGEHRLDRPLTAREREELAEQERAMRALGYLGGDDEEPSGAPAEGPRGRGGDWLHTNAIDHRPDLDLIVLSVRTFDELWVLDHSTTTEEARGSTGGRFGRGGELLARYGNPRAHGAGEANDRVLFGQHDARWIRAGSPGEGHLTVFNNGDDRPGERHSSVEELAVDLDALTEGGEGLAPVERVWSYVAPEPTSFYSSFISGAERLPNGNTLICEGAKGRLFEVTPGGAIVWEYWNPFGEEPPPEGIAGPGAPDDAERPPPRGGPNMAPGGLFRATRLAPDHPGLVGKGLPNP